MISFFQAFIWEIISIGIKKIARQSTNKLLVYLHMVLRHSPFLLLQVLVVHNCELHVILISVLPSLSKMLYQLKNSLPHLDLGNKFRNVFSVNVLCKQTPKLKSGQEITQHLSYCPSDRLRNYIEVTRLRSVCKEFSEPPYHVAFPAKLNHHTNEKVPSIRVSYTHSSTFSEG